MRKFMAGIAALLLIQSAAAETLTTAQDYAVDSDVVLESAVREIKSVPRDTVDVIGDSIKYVADETVTAVQGVAAVFASDPVEKAERAGIIEVADAWDSSDEIIFRSYKVTGEVGNELAMGGTMPSGTAVDVSGFFTGLEFPEGTSAYYRPEFNRLMVRQTLPNLLAIEDVLAEQHSAVRDLMGKQIEIETKFVEVNQSTLNELGFRWSVDGSGEWDSDGNNVGTGNGDWNLFQDLFLPAGTDLLNQGLRTAAGALGTGVASDTFTLTKSTGYFQWSATINALEQDTDTDVLSAPRIVTRDGNTASITVGEQRMVSTGFDVDSAESSLFIEHDLDSQIMGVQLEVTPELRGDDLIDLELKPRVIDLIGYEEYQVSPDNAAFTYWSVNNVAYTGSKAIPTLGSRVPYYRLREMETQVTIADGSTVGMGGLIYDKLETYKDKVPVLGSIPLIGRLFRSEGENNVKRNLMIFVTATQVDVNGRRAADMALNK